MTKLEKLMANPDNVREFIMDHMKVIMEQMKDARNLPSILRVRYCPSDFGMEDHCSEDQNCEWCWSREVEE